MKNILKLTLPSRPINPPSEWIPWLAWALLGNENDGPIGDKNWNPSRKDTLWIRTKWWFRNPLHNLLFYVVGCAHKNRVVWGFPHPGVFDPNDGWNFTYTISAKGVFPFVSYSGPIRFYIGWRMGAFGIKLVRNKEYVAK